MATKGHETATNGKRTASRAPRQPILTNRLGQRKKQALSGVWPPVLAASLWHFSSEGACYESPQVSAGQGGPLAPRARESGVKTAAPAEASGTRQSVRGVSRWTQEERVTLASSRASSHALECGGWTPL
jgi:hypothetical protein